MVFLELKEKAEIVWFLFLLYSGRILLSMTKTMLWYLLCCNKVVLATFSNPLNWINLIGILSFGGFWTALDLVALFALLGNPTALVPKARGEAGSPPGTGSRGSHVVRVASAVLLALVLAVPILWVFSNISFLNRFSNKTSICFWICGSCLLRPVLTVP